MLAHTAFTSALFREATGCAHCKQAYRAYFYEEPRIHPEDELAGAKTSDALLAARHPAATSTGSRKLA